MKKYTFRWIAFIGAMVIMAFTIPSVSRLGRPAAWLDSFFVRWLSNGVDGRIDFYGRVTDQYGSPVEGVKIQAHLRKFRFSLPGTPWRITEIHLNTDSQGNFKIVGQSGTGISFYDFKKSGYEYLYPNENTSFNYERNTNGIFLPDLKAPIIYRMRKKGEEAYVIFNEKVPCFSYEQKESGLQKGFDLIIGNTIKEKDFGHPMLGDIPLTCDIRTKADYNPKTNRWKLQIWPGDSSGGIIVSREKWYVAPSDGYLTNYAIDPDIFIKEFNLASTNKPWIPSNGDAYVYLKSRTPPVYTRFCISDVRIDERGLRASAGGSVTNPYGDRNFEAATELPWRVRSKLHQEVRDSYINGRRPLKPDLSKLIQEEKMGK